MSVDRQAPLNGRIKVRHLTCFIEVARLKSAIKAASVLGLSQPAVSKTIHELEENLGAILFEQNRRAMILTSTGDVFLKYATSSMTALKQGVRMVAHGAAGAQTAFTIGALPTISARILPTALASLSNDFPDLKLRVVTGSNDVLISQLRLGDIDLVVGRMPPPDAMRGLAFEYLYAERIALAVRPGHPLLSRPSIRFTEIGDFQLLVPPPGSVIHPIIERYFIAHSISPSRGEIETVSDTFARNYLLRTDAIWFISEGVVAEDESGGILATLPLNTDDTIGPVGLTIRTDAELLFPASLVMTALRAACQLVEDALEPVRK